MRELIKRERERMREKVQIKGKKALFDPVIIGMRRERERKSICAKGELKFEREIERVCERNKALFEPVFIGNRKVLTLFPIMKSNTC